MNITVGVVLQALNCEAYEVLPDGQIRSNGFTRAELERQFADVTVDSRTVVPGSLFVALPGQRVDGNDFVPDAIRNGARGCILERLPDSVSRGPEAQAEEPGFLFLVGDALQALQALSNYWRRLHHCTVVGITGSIGKTTTKEIVSGVLEPHLAVLRSEANLNTEIGVPLTLLRLRSHHRVAVVEMGMHVPGDISELVRIADPDIGVVTNVAPIHLERCGSIERIARGKSEMVAKLPATALAILNGDNPWTRAMATTATVARSELVGSSPHCTYRAEDVRTQGLDGLTFAIVAEGARTTVKTRIPGIHTVHAFLIAAAIARELQIDWPSIAAAIEHVHLNARQRLSRTAEGFVLIDDAYNAAPPSMVAALQLLSAGEGTRIAVLGDMLELGPDERQLHTDVGRAAAEVADWLVTRGERARWIADGAVAAGMSPERVQQTATNMQAIDAVRRITSRVPVAAGAEGSNTMRRSDTSGAGAGLVTILVKGSRGMRMEEVVEELEAGG